nr:hypothetical protein [Bdellovibrionales bacterium]
MTRPKKDQVRKVGKSLDSGQKDKSYLDFAGLSRIAYKRELVNRYLAANATPFMILEQAEIVKSLGYFRRHLPEVQLYYAVKANPHPHVLTTVKSHGAFVDVASHGEILKALEHGFTGAQMILANPYKNEAALKAMFELGISMFTFDSHRELQRIADFKKRHGYDFSPKCLLRFRPQVTKFSRASDGPEVQVNLASKFGAPVEEGLELLGLAKQLALQPSGIAYHIGSNCYRVPNYINNFKSAIALLREANARLNLNMSIVDLGGGFPNHTATAKGVEDLDEFYQRIAAGLRAE